MLALTRSGSGVSLILGVFGDELLSEGAVRDILRRARPDDQRWDVWCGEGALLGVSRPEWQMAEGMACGELVVEVDGLAVVADASLYYRGQLVEALQREGGHPRGAGPAHLIAAAYRVWGQDAVDRLEGDWAFILWDQRQRLVLAARDFAGRRTLYHAATGDTLVVASAIPAVLAHPAIRTELNPVAVAETAAGFMASSHETCYRGVRCLLAGHTLRAQNGAVRTFRHWNPAPREDRNGEPFTEAALHLRGLLTAAVGERMSSGGPTSIQLSGGWDSTAIYAVGKDLLSSRPDSGDSLLPVSISYPQGDPGREDEIIQMILDHWSSSTHWIRSGDIPLFERPLEAAATRAEPFAHVYEHWNRRLVQAGRTLGTRVMLDGFGGDSLFQSSPIYFSDLLRRGRLIELRREWKAKGMRGASPAIQWCVQPLLPSALLHLLPRRLGGPGSGSRERRLPSWIEPSFEREHGLLDRERRNTPRYGRDTAASDELHWHLTNPWISRMLAENYSFGLAAGVEARSPLFDRRVIEFAIQRPWQERSFRKQTKRLLRRSVQGLLPDDVLAPRRYRTGMTTGFFERHMRAELPELRERVLRNPILSELGIIDPVTLNRSIDEYFAVPNAGTGVQIFFTLSTELWLRAHASGEGLEVPEPRLSEASLVTSGGAIPGSDDRQRG
jgi:asparagine synthase (glutamine-hydrolysing)